MELATAGDIIDRAWGDVSGKRGVERPKENVISFPLKKPRFSALIVEDDMSSMHMLDVALQSTGQFTKLDWATSAEEAVRFLQDRVKAGRPEPYDLIFIDIFLDGRRTGVDLWNFLNEESLQTVPVIMTSGISEDRFAELMGRYTIVPKFLRKPFQMSRCMETINDAMNRPTWN
jgi:response regulator of citrate/malate metabolism